MEIINILLHIDTYLVKIIDLFGSYTYLLLFLTIFIETGLVVFPFLPGDSVLFAAGALASSVTAFHILPLYILLIIAAISGDSLNYWIGRMVGKRAFTTDSKFFKAEYLKKAQAFYERHGGKAIFLSRFIPIIRTFAPFVAGIANMHYPSFLSYNVSGGITWISVFLGLGYFFGNIPFFKKNFELVIVLILVISALPVVWELIQSRRAKKQ